MITREKIGKYEVLSVLGRGGMGVVYKARDPFIDRIVAIKTIHLDSNIEEEDLVARLEMEAKSAGRLQHPNIATVYDFGKEGDLSYIVIEFLEGADLQELIDQRVNLSLPQRLDLLIQISNGLAFAHDVGVVHRDMKPANIRVTQKGTAKIIDFGLARFDTTRLTKTGFVSGTVAFMSPERFSGQSGPSDDIFALGAIAFEVLTYQRAHPGSSPAEVMMKIISAAPPAPSEAGEVPPVLDPIIQKCLARDVAERYATAGEFAKDLEHVLAADEYRDFANSDDRSPEFIQALQEWTTSLSTISSGRRQLFTSEVPTVTLSREGAGVPAGTGRTEPRREAPFRDETQVVKESPETEILASGEAGLTEVSEPSEFLPAGGPAPHSGSTLTEPPPTIVDRVRTVGGTPETAGGGGLKSRRFMLLAALVAALVVGGTTLTLLTHAPEPEESLPPSATTLEPELLPVETEGIEPEIIAGVGDEQKELIAAYRSELQALPLSSTERLRLRDIETASARGEEQIVRGEFEEGVATLHRAIGDLRDLLASHEKRRSAERTAASRTQSQPVTTPAPPKRVETVPDPEPSRRTPPPPAEPAESRSTPTSTAPATTPSVPQRTEAGATQEIRAFIRDLAAAYQNRDVEFFRRHYAAFDPAFARAIRESPSTSVEIRIDSISLDGTDRASVDVTRTDRFRDTRMAPASQSLRYELRRADDLWMVVSFRRR